MFFDGVKMMVSRGICAAGRTHARSKEEENLVVSRGVCEGGCHEEQRLLMHQEPWRQRCKGESSMLTAERNSRRRSRSSAKRRRGR